MNNAGMKQDQNQICGYSNNTGFSMHNCYFCTIQSLQLFWRPSLMAWFVTLLVWGNNCPSTKERFCSLLKATKGCMCWWMVPICWLLVTKGSNPFNKSIKTDQSSNLLCGYPSTLYISALVSSTFWKSCFFTAHLPPISMHPRTSTQM